MNDDPINDLPAGETETPAGGDEAQQADVAAVAWMVSRSGTRHIIPPSAGASRGRISSLCGFSFRTDDEPHEPRRDCEFCLAEAAAAQRGPS